MGKRPLSIMPYYGGKARMAAFIAERLNYDDTTIYIEPFGGACRTLLNKPRHQLEIYNDLDEGLYAIMSALSNPQTAKDFIYRLMDTEYSEEQFLKSKKNYDHAQYNLEQQARENIKNFLIKNNIVSPWAVNKTTDFLLEQFIDYNENSEEEIEPESTYNNDTNNKAHSKATDKWMLNLLNEVNKDVKLKNELISLLANYKTIYDHKVEQGYIERSRDVIRDAADSDMNLAVDTYITFMQSRDAMGQTFSHEKFKSNMQYHKQVAKLFKCAERMENVLIYEMDAMDFFRQILGINRDQTAEVADSSDAIKLPWIHDPQVMVYADPSYINPRSERELLEGIDWKSVDSLSGAIKKKYENKKVPANLGKLYTTSFNYDDHEEFLKCIYDASCKIMVSNYDLILYNKYLNEDNGWRRIEFPTKTSVGGKAGNDRLEVLWYNY
ncbi:DNA adenine methylase [Marasmitruncus massiliensis]|uniref:DNA adenine methylase n=1 Tax=Marasmitruncus massiliensis TaxID=1944642 RepID=UPI000C79F150|nr:DNA adenine methylase [Marasmitruncus massiliensis]